MDPSLDTKAGLSSLKIDLVPSDAEGDRSLGTLLDSTFPVPAGSHFFDDFPIWDSTKSTHLAESGRMARLGVYDGEELVGCACVRLAELKLSDKRLKVALIGAVATRQAYQGHGFASRLVAIAVTWAKERGSAAAVLWGSEHALYQRQGFELCGQQLRVKLEGLKLPGTADSGGGTVARAPAVREGWNPALFALLMKRDGGLVLGENDLAWVQAHRGVEWYWTGDPAAPSAYAALGRGIDLKGMVHEWGGRRGELLSLLAAIRAKHPMAELLGPTWHFDRYTFSYDPAGSEFLCLAKILDIPAVLSCFPGGNAPAPDFRGTTDAETIRALLGPPSEQAPFPLPFWIWGIDAV